MKLTQLILCIFLCIIVGSISGFFSVGETEVWYADLNKPQLIPPDWVFGLVWTLLYIAMGLSLYFYLVQKTTQNKTGGFIFFFVQLTFNFFWSLFFFKMHNPALAMWDVVGLIIALIMAMWMFRNVSAKAFYLLIPYLLWACYSAWLNYRILLLNPGI